MQAAYAQAPTHDGSDWTRWGTTRVACGSARCLAAANCSGDQAGPRREHFSHLVAAGRELFRSLGTLLHGNAGAIFLSLGHHTRADDSLETGGPFKTGGLAFFLL